MVGLTICVVQTLNHKPDTPNPKPKQEGWTFMCCIYVAGMVPW